MENNKVRIEYLLSEAGRKKSLLAGGDGQEQQGLETDITPELLERATVNRYGVAVWRVGYVPANAKIIGTYDFGPFRIDVRESFYEEHRPRIDTKREQKYFDAPQTAESLRAFVEAAEAKVSTSVIELEKQLPEKVALWEQGVAEHKAMVEKIEANRKAQEAAKKAERSRREAEKAEWIAAHGSDYLKRCAKLDYDCQRQYVAERAEMEFPDYALDFDDKAHWRSRACPGEEALIEVERLIGNGHKAEVVWLTHPPYEITEEDKYIDGPFEECEAIVIAEFLGKYYLVKIL